MGCEYPNPGGLWPPACGGDRRTPTSAKQSSSDGAKTLNATIRSFSPTTMLGNTMKINRLFGVFCEIALGPWCTHQEAGVSFSGIAYCVFLPRA